MFDSFFTVLQKKEEKKFKYKFLNSNALNVCFSEKYCLHLNKEQETDQMFWWILHTYVPQFDQPQP